MMQENHDKNVQKPNLCFVQIGTLYFSRVRNNFVCYFMFDNQHSFAVSLQLVVENSGQVKRKKKKKKRERLERLDKTRMLSRRSVSALPSGADKLDHLALLRRKLSNALCQDKIHNCFNFIVRRYRCDSRGRIFQRESPILSFLRLHLRFYLATLLTRARKSSLEQGTILIRPSPSRASFRRESRWPPVSLNAGVTN